MELAPTEAVARAGLMLCVKEEKMLAVRKAPGSCPYCAGEVEATDVEAKWVLLCFLPISAKIKRRFACAACSRRLHRAHELVAYSPIVVD